MEPRATSSAGANTPRSVMMAVTSSAGVTSNAGFHDLHAVRRRTRARASPATSSRGALLDRDGGAVGRGGIDRRGGRRT